MGIERKERFFSEGGVFGIVQKSVIMIYESGVTT
jgi:hypothetical protein